MDERNENHQLLNALASKTPTPIKVNEVKQLHILSSMDFKSNIAIVFKVKATTLPAKGNVGIVENCRSEDGSTIKIWINKTVVEAKLKLNDDKMISVTAPVLEVQQFLLIFSQISLWHNKLFVRELYFFSLKIPRPIETLLGVE